MKISGSYKLPADPETVWATLLDPDALEKSIPGAESFTLDGDDAYKVDLNIGVAAIKGKYSGRVEIADQQQPSSFTLVVDGKGAKGAVNGSALFTRRASRGRQWWPWRVKVRLQACSLASASDCSAVWPSC
jgi:carbon monoxide dehydrogenase subunit G